MESSTCFPHCVFARPPRTPLSPPPTHLSTTNDIPMDSEVRTTREHIQVGRTRLSKIDQEIGFLERLLVARLSERQHVKDTIAQHLTIISPMRTLPYDILGEIFSYTLPRFWSTEMSLSSCVLTRVCRNWRNIVMFSLPMLWSNICIESDHDIPSLAIQLERSGSCPLTIHFSSTNISAFKLILDHSDRWHTINLRLKEEMIPLLDKAIGNLSLLRSLTYWGELVSSCKAFESAPRLDRVIFYRDNGTLPIPYRQLLRLRQYIPQTLHAAASLRLANNLTELTLWGARASQDVGSPIELPRLHMLRISDGTFLEFLVLPALEDIFIDQTSFPLISLIHRSSCMLRKLVTLDIAGTFALLEHIPTLSELHCVDHEMDIISRLIIPSHADSNIRPLCPELRTLNIRCGPNGVDDFKVTQLMESRHKTTLWPSLSLYVYNFFSATLPPHVLQMQSTLRQCGMNVQCLNTGSANQYFASQSDPYP